MITQLVPYFIGVMFAALVYAMFKLLKGMHHMSEKIMRGAVFVKINDSDIIINKEENSVIALARQDREIPSGGSFYHDIFITTTLPGSFSAQAYTKGIYGIKLSVSGTCNVDIDNMSAIRIYLSNLTANPVKIEKGLELLEIFFVEKSQIVIN